jgi:serine/threonine protein kinase
MSRIDHQKLFEAGVLHRDVSSGNVIINISGAGQVGYLIDFDHAKLTEEFATWPPTPVTESHRFDQAAKWH